jgi:hypothetical protein
VLEIRKDSSKSFFSLSANFFPVSSFLLSLSSAPPPQRPRERTLRQSVEVYFRTGRRYFILIFSAQTAQGKTLTQ